MMDFDGNSVVDIDDLDQFVLTYESPLDDCNANSQLDLSEILLNPPLDADGNGVIDACETVPGDATGDGLVNVDDLFAVIGQWGPCSGCATDFDGNGFVDIDDLFTVIGNWS